MRFTIRDVLWLMVVVGLAVGWCAHSSSWAKFHDAVYFDLNARLLALQDSLWESQGETIGLEEKNRDLEAELDGRSRQLRSLLQLNEDAPLPNHWDKLSATGQPISD